MNLSSVVNFTDATMLAMALPNLITIFILIKEIKADLIQYCKKHNLITFMTKPWFKENVSA